MSRAGRVFFFLVREQVLEVTPLKEVGDFKAECYAVWGQVTMVSMELTVLGEIPFGVRIVCLLWPLDCIAHVLHDGYTLNGFNIEGVLEDPSLVPVV